MIAKRKEQIRIAPDLYKEKGDFLTALLKDEYFNGNEKWIMDECVTFLSAAT